MEMMLIFIFCVLFYIALMFSLWTVYLDRRLSNIQDEINELREIRRGKNDR